MIIGLILGLVAGVALGLVVGLLVRPTMSPRRGRQRPVWLTRWVGTGAGDEILELRARTVDQQGQLSSLHADAARLNSELAHERSAAEIRPPPSMRPGSS